MNSPSKALNISFIQADLVWENKQANFSLFESLFHETDQPDLVVLPEMFSTGFSMQPAALYDQEPGMALRWMQTQAEKHQFALAGSVIVNDFGNYYNRFYFVQPDGSYQSYDKRHLFRMANEHLHYTPGNQRVIIEYQAWRILPQVCYDLRFPVWSRNRADYDLLLYVANWPEKRRAHWLTLLQARAIENQAYVLGVNRTGHDGKNIRYSGDSALFAPDGTRLSPNSYRKNNMVHSQWLSHEPLHQSRSQFPAWQDADDFHWLH